MSKLASTSNTIKQLGITGIGIDKLDKTLYLYHQLESKIVHHTIQGLVGEYYVEGDVTDFINGYTDFWVTNREMNDDNVFNVISADYEPENLWTKIVITTLGSYRANFNDVGAYICGRIDVTSRVKELGVVSHKLNEEGSLSNSVASEFNFTFNDEDKVFYDRNLKSGYFYKKDIVTEVESIQDQSSFSAKSGVFSTFIKVKFIPKYWTGSDFVNGKIEFLDGEAIGIKSTIVNGYGDSLNVLGHYGKNYTTNKFNYNIKADDPVRIYKSENFWFKLDMWLRGEESDIVSVICGKLDLDSLSINDEERTIQISGFNTIKDLQVKSLSEVDFDGGTNLSRMHEFKAIVIDKPAQGVFKLITKKLIEANPLNSIDIKQVAFDVSEGWHVLDFHPDGNLFRFDLGRWFKVTDEGSFEKSTGQVFLLSDDSPDYNFPAKMPASDGIWKGEVLGLLNTPPGTPMMDDIYAVDDTPTGDWADHKGELALYTGFEWFFTKVAFSSRVYDSGASQSLVFDGENWSTNIDQVNNQLIERNWHGKWASIAISVEEAFNVGGTNGMFLGDQNYKWKKLSGLPSIPHRLLFHVDKDRLIDVKNIFEYNYDNGGFVVPNILFDYIQQYNTQTSTHKKDLTYRLGFGCTWDKKNTVEPAGYYTEDDVYDVIRCYSFKKFNGIMINFDNKGFDAVNPNHFENAGAGFIAHLQLKHSIGDNVFSNNICLYYLGCRLISRDSEYTYTLYVTPLSDSFDGNYSAMVGMKLLCISHDEFLNFRTITSVSTASGAPDYINNCISIDIDKPFDNIGVGAVDYMFMVMNKDFNIKMQDLGGTFKEGVCTDLAAVYYAKLSQYKDFKSYDSFTNEYREDHESLPIVSDFDQIFIGHRSKFDGIFIIMRNNFLPALDDFANIAYPIREPTFIVEYYDGAFWRSAEEVCATPSNIIPVSDSATIDRTDDLVKYKISFKTHDWTFGGYDNSSWANTEYCGSPSSIDPTKIYLIRVSVKLGVTVNLKNFGILNKTETSLCLTWENLNNWTTNNVPMKNSMVSADTHNIDDISLQMYGIEVMLHNDHLGVFPYDSTILLRSAIPLNRFQGASGDSIYAGIDFNSIDQNVNSDLVISSNKSHNGISHFPKNVSFMSIIENLIKNSGIPISNDIYVDSYNTINKPLTNIVGTDYDGVYPNEVGWDAALTNSVFSRDGYFTLPNNGYVYRDICVRRYNEKFWMWALRTDRVTMDVYESDDLKAWSIAYEDILVVNGGEVINVEICHNRGDEYSGVYLTYRPTYGTGDYVVGVVTTVTPYTIDTLSIVDIISDAGKHFGKVSALQLEGKAADTTACARILSVIKYASAAETSGVPTATSKATIYSNADAAIDGTWTYRAISIISMDSITFVKSEYTCTTNAPFYASTNGLQKFILIGGDSATSTVVRLTIDIADWSIVEVDLGDSDFGSICAVNDGYIYNLRDQAAESAFTLVPTNVDYNILVGVYAGAITYMAINSDVVSFSSTGLYKNCIMEQNELDWFKTYSNSIIFDNIDANKKKIYLGFRKPFSKIDCIPASESFYFNKLQIKYWNGTSLELMPILYQNGKKYTTGKFSPVLGINFQKPLDWVSDKFQSVVNPSALLISQKSDSLYWVEISLDDSAAVTDYVDMKRFTNCYTCTFMTKGRTLFFMDNWDYVRTIHNYNQERDKNIRIDSIAFDKESKSAIINYVEDNPYGIRPLESLVFDAFGNFKTSSYLWLNKTYEGVNQYQILKDKPESIYRVGGEYNPSYPSTDLFFNIIGFWNKSYLSDVYGNTMAAASSGLNIPVASEQLIRKYMVRNKNWEDNGVMSKTYLNNIILGKRDSTVHLPVDSTTSFENSMRLLFYSLTNNGLLNEELINGPFVKVSAGYYAAYEKNVNLRGDAYDLQVEGSCTYAGLPGSPIISEAWILTNVEVDSIAWWDGVKWNIKKPTNGMVVFNDAVNSYWEWTGNSWKDLGSSDIWPGRNGIYAGDKGIGLEWTLGQQGVNIPYFKPYNLRPDLYANNNANNEFDYKMVKSLRHISLGSESEKVFGHDMYDAAAILPQNLKPTCAVLLPDLSAVKDTTINSTYKNIDGNSPTIAFGCYMFKEKLRDSIPTRYNSGTGVIDPLTYMAICLFKPYGRVQYWDKAWYYDGSYSDVTELMNYKGDNSTELDLTDNDQCIYVGSSTKFFGISLNKNDDLANKLFFEYWDGYNWISLITTPVDNLTDSLKTFMNLDQWSKKTVGYNYIFDPFMDVWKKRVINSSDSLYWIRIYHSDVDNPTDTSKILWAALAGSVLFDNMRWWADYSVVSTKAEGTDYDYFDTFVPISLEYDIVRKKLIGCVWDFAVNVNKYYPFVINFDRERISGIVPEYWDWAVSRIEVIDVDGKDYSHKLQSIQNVSPIDNKALMIQDSKPDGTAAIGVIKNFYSGEKLFNLDI